MENIVLAEGLEISLTKSFTQTQMDSMIGGEHDPFQSLVHGLQWRSPDQHVLIREGALDICHVGLVAHTVKVNNISVKVVGLGGVFTKREYRGRGLGGVAMRAAQSVAAQEVGAEFMFLFCRPGMRGWYETQGWVMIRDTVWVEQPAGTVAAPLLAMTKQLGSSPWPSGEVQLHSLPW